MLFSDFPQFISNSTQNGLFLNFKSLLLITLKSSQIPRNNLRTVGGNGGLKMG